MIRKILFVDDDESILDAAKTALEVYGYNVITAKSGKECLEKMGDVDLIFLDIKMPEMDGIETLKRIKEKDASMPVIMITAYATVDTAIEAMKKGAFDYIKKPFDMDELESSILAAIEDLKFRKFEEEEDCFERFKKLVEKNKGICITREIEKVKDIKNTILIKMEKELKPRKLQEIKNDIEKNIERGIVILLTNIEYLLRENKLEDLRDFLEWLSKKASMLNCKLILSAALRNIREKEKKDLQDLMADIHIGIISESISNYIRRKIINLLSDGKKYSFTKIAQEIGIEDNPKLSFHLKKLKDDGVLEQDEEKKYYLSKLGKEIAEFIEEMKKNKLKRKEEILWMPFK